MENEELEVIEIINESDDKVREIIQGFEDRTTSLSYSSIREFLKSPRHLISYKLRKYEQYKPTESMIFGDLVDCLVTQPDKFESKFFLLPAGGNFASKAGIEIYLNHFQIANLGNMDANKAAIRYEIEKLEQSGANKINVLQLEQARLIVKKMNSNLAFYNTFMDISSYQVPVEFDFEGWKIRGFADAESEEKDFVFDLKQCPVASDRKVRMKIKDERLLLQQSIYSYGLGRQQGRLGFYDRSGHFSVYRVGSADLEHNLGLLRNAISELEHCIFEERWFQSYDFWANRYDGIFDL
jgi:hypothetical protein